MKWKHRYYNDIITEVYLRETESAKYKFIIRVFINIKPIYYVFTLKKKKKIGSNRTLRLYNIRYTSMYIINYMINIFKKTQL